MVYTYMYVDYNNNNMKAYIIIHVCITDVFVNFYVINVVM